MSSKTRVALFVVGVGVALLLSPAVILSLDIGDPTYKRGGRLKSAK